MSKRLNRRWAYHSRMKTLCRQVTMGKFDKGLRQRFLNGALRLNVFAQVEFPFKKCQYVPHFAEVIGQSSSGSHDPEKANHSILKGQD